MKKFFVSLIFGVLVIATTIFILNTNSSGQLLSPLGISGPIATPTPKPRIYDKYSFNALSARTYSPGEIKLEKIIKKEIGYTSWLFSFQVEGKKETGMLNLPSAINVSSKGKIITSKKWPVIIMVRGYADEEIYFTGLGTRKAAGVFAQNGFITAAPDLLGFGDSDQASADILENRFYRPVEILSLIASLEKDPLINPDHLFLWGHSNGGQIVLSVLEISGRNIPTTLWAPVSEGFPQSVLQYLNLNNLDEAGLRVKNTIDDFLLDYDPKLYSIDNYFYRIKGPIQIHHGLADPLIPIEWTNNLVAEVKKTNANVKYYKYPKNDHNLAQSWDTVITRDLNFFKTNSN